MTTALIIGAIVALVMGLPAFVWLTKLIRPPKPEEEAIHRGIAEARKREARRRENMPYHRG
jgi:hypothetical protein